MNIILGFIGGFGLLIIAFGIGNILAFFRIRKTGETIGLTGYPFFYVSIVRGKPALVAAKMMLIYGIFFSIIGLIVIMIPILLIITS